MKGVGTQYAMEGDQMMDQQQEARTLTLGEWMILAARLAVVEHLRQSINEVPLDSSYFSRTDFSDSSGEFIPYPEDSQDPAVCDVPLLKIAFTTELAGAA